MPLFFMISLFKSKPFFSKQEQEQLVQSIQDAEHLTSGEIRLHVEPRCTGNTLDRSREVFAQLKMHETEHRNGILFYLAYESRQFAIWGDEGIHVFVQQSFWDKLSSELMSGFKQGDITSTLCSGILQAGEKLKVHFPYQSNDRNELSDAISFGEGAN